MYLYLRPGLFTFLDQISRHFEIILFNNGSKPYTDEIVKQIRAMQPDQDMNYFTHQLSKEDCSINENGHEIKNLDFFVGQGSNREIKNCIIIDNSLYCFQKHITNGLLIPKYENSSKDDWLELVKDYLMEKIVNPGVEDVRKVIG